jgi:hypothetical protein
MGVLERYVKPVLWIRITLSLWYWSMRIRIHNTVKHCLTIMNALPIADTKFRTAVGNSKVKTWKIRRRNWRFVIDTYGAEAQVPPEQMFTIVFLTANNCKRWRGIFQRLPEHGLSAPHPYVKAYRYRTVSTDATCTQIHLERQHLYRTYNIYNKYSWN